MTLTQMRCPYCDGKNVEAQRTYPITMWRTTDHVPLCLLCTVFFRNTPYPHCPFENTHCPRGASPCSPDRRGRHQRGDTPLWCEQK